MIFAFFNASVFALFLQNLVFNGGFGMSEAIRIATKPKDFFPIALLVAFFTSATAAVCSLLDSIDVINSLTTAEHMGIYCFVLAVIYLIFTAVIILIFHKKKDTHRIGMAAVNTLVLAVPIINRRAAFDISESIGLGLGAGVAFVIAVLLISSAEERIKSNDTMSNAFKGKPALFIYIALISLGFAGLSGQSLFV
ncbi:MAG: hypothetical protein IJ261_00155 [Clostridia bacterium]|nr:hypothetical protein [Clostridia bacterium]